MWWFVTVTLRGPAGDAAGEIVKLALESLEHPAQKMAHHEGSHLKFTGLFDIDMPSSAPKLDASNCTSLSAARAASPAFEDVVARAEKFCAAVDGAQAWFTGGKGVRIALTKLRPELFLTMAAAQSMLPSAPWDGRSPFPLNVTLG